MAFRAARERVGYSQSEVARILGLDSTTVVKWEGGVNMPRAATLAKLAALYCCSIEELLDSNSPAPPKRAEGDPGNQYNEEGVRGDDR